jgi:8-oxo-dGTP pyrophosphatase MutT (NUDIX family)
MKKIHAVGVMLEDEQGRILVLRRHPQKPEGTAWGLPGGKIDPGEDREAAAIREVWEETGHTVDPSKLQFLKTYHYLQPDNLDVTFEVFKLPASSAELTVAMNPAEHTEYQWMLPQDLYQQTDLMFGFCPILKDIYDF